MVQNIQNHPSTLASVGDAAYKIGDYLLNGIVMGKSTWLSREITAVTERHLPPAIAKITATAIHAIPFAISYLFMPASALPVALGICLVGRIISLLQEVDIDHPSSVDINNIWKPISVGMGAVKIAKGIQALALGIIRKDVLHAIEGAGDIIFGFIGWARTDIFGEIVDATIETKNLIQNRWSQQRTVAI